MSVATADPKPVPAVNRRATRTHTARKKSVPPPCPPPRLLVIVNDDGTESHGLADYPAGTPHCLKDITAEQHRLVACAAMQSATDGIGDGDSHDFYFSILFPTWKGGVWVWRPESSTGESWQSRNLCDLFSLTTGD